MIKKIRFLIVGMVMLLAIVLLINKPRESEAESLLSYAKEDYRRLRRSLSESQHRALTLWKMTELLRRGTRRCCSICGL